MKNSILLFTLLITTSSTFYGQNQETDQVQKSFDNYKSSILNDQGEKAVEYVDSRTIKYYSQILETTRNADSTAVISLGIMDKLLVFSIRHRASKKDILSFDGKGLLVYAIKKGMVGKNSVVNTEIGKVDISGNFAKGEFISNGQKAPFYFHFYKENDNWKVNLTSLFPSGISVLKKMVEESGQGEDEFMFTILEMLTGKKPGSEIWKPIL